MTNQTSVVSVLRSIPARLRALLQGVDAEIETQIRAVGLSALYEQVRENVNEYNPMAWIMDVFQGDGGELFAVVAQDGKLFRVDFTVDSGRVEMGAWIEVMQEFVPTGRMFITRQADGSYRGFMISSAAVLNRVNEIDSTELHQNMNRRAVETGLYPFVDFFHLGETFRMGQVDFLGLDGYVAVASFLFDETPLGRAMVKAYESDPEYWGASISYYPIGKPEMLRVGGTEIPVYKDGRYQAITICPERVAASPFTTLYAKEVIRMDKVLIEALQKLAGDDAEVKKIVKSFIDTVDETNRTIENRDLVRRDAVNAEANAEETPAEPETETPADAQETPAAAAVETPAEETTAQNVGEVVLDEAAISAITEHFFGSEAWQNALTPVMNAITELTNSVQGLQTELGNVRTSQDTIDQRLRTVEATDETKQKEWEADLSRRTKRTLNVTHRPSQAVPSTPNASGTTSFQDIAAGTLANLKK